MAAGLEALDGFITERTAWLIEHHMLGHQIADGTLGGRASIADCARANVRRLAAPGAIATDAGRQAGVEAPELDEALDYLRELGGMFDPD